MEEEDKEHEAWLRQEQEEGWQQVTSEESEGEEEQSKEGGEKQPRTKSLQLSRSRISEERFICEVKKVFSWRKDVLLFTCAVSSQPVVLHPLQAASRQTIAVDVQYENTSTKEVSDIRCYLLALKKGKRQSKTKLEEDTQRRMVLQGLLAASKPGHSAPHSSKEATMRFLLPHATHFKPNHNNSSDYSYFLSLECVVGGLHRNIKAKLPISILALPG